MFYLSEFGGTLKCVFRQYSEFFLSEFSLEIRRFQGCLFSSSLTMHPNKNIFRVLHHPAGESGETRGRGVGAEHHLRRRQLSPQAGVHHLLPQQ